MPTFNYTIISHHTVIASTASSDSNQKKSKAIDTNNADGRIDSVDKVTGKRSNNQGDEMNEIIKYA